MTRRAKMREIGIFGGRLAIWELIPLSIFLTDIGMFNDQRDQPVSRPGQCDLCPVFRHRTGSSAGALRHWRQPIGKQGINPPSSPR